MMMMDLCWCEEWEGGQGTVITTTYLRIMRPQHTCYVQMLTGCQTDRSSRLWRQTADFRGLWQTDTKVNDSCKNGGGSRPLVEGAPGPGPRPSCSSRHRHGGGPSRCPWQQHRRVIHKRGRVNELNILIFCEHFWGGGIHIVGNRVTVRLDSVAISAALISRR